MPSANRTRESDWDRRDAPCPFCSASRSPRWFRCCRRLTPFSRACRNRPSLNRYCPTCQYPRSCRHCRPRPNRMLLAFSICVVTVLEAAGVAGNFSAEFECCCRNRLERCVPRHPVKSCLKTTFHRDIWCQNSRISRRCRVFPHAL